MITGSSPHPSPTYDALIIGAGLAGLKAARDSQSAGRRVLVLDKGRGVGGRAATRRWDGVPVDHGAQFFTARSEEFRAQVADWLARGVCFEWTKGFHQWDDDGRGLRAPDPADDGHPRYACHAGMSALGKDLAAGLAAGTVRLGARVTALRRAGETWRAAVEGTDEIFAARQVLLTLPAPQALALFGDGDLDPATRQTLETVGTDPSIAVLLRGEVPPPEWRAIQIHDAALAWLAVDSSKREGSTGGLIFVMHGTGPFSRAVAGRRSGRGGPPADRTRGRDCRRLDHAAARPTNPPLALRERAARVERPAVPEHGGRQALLRGRCVPGVENRRCLAFRAGGRTGHAGGEIVQL